MPLDLDYSGVERPSFDPVPEDDYDLILEDIVVKDGKSNAADKMAHCTFTVDGGEFDGKKILHFQSLLSEEGKKWSKTMFESLYGYPIDSDFRLDEDDLIGRKCSAHVTVQADNRDSSRQQNRISYFILPFEVD